MHTFCLVLARMTNIPPTQYEVVSVDANNSTPKMVASPTMSADVGVTPAIWACRRGLAECMAIRAVIRPLHIGKPNLDVLVISEIRRA